MCDSCGSATPSIPTLLLLLSPTPFSSSSFFPSLPLLCLLYFIFFPQPAYAMRSSFVARNCSSLFDFAFCIPFETGGMLSRLSLETLGIFLEHFRQFVVCQILNYQFGKSQELPEYILHPKAYFWILRINSLQHHILLSYHIYIPWRFSFKSMMKPNVWWLNYYPYTNI